MADDMVIFTRTFDLLMWILPQAEKFPKTQRFILTKRLTDAILDFQEALFDAHAHREAKRLEYLRMADSHLNKARLYLRLVHRMGWLTDGQYEHVSVMVTEIGRLLGGWLKRENQ
jgi:four helix bundle protein